MKANNITIGYLGEAIAKEYLENQGYKIIAQNYKTKYAEIDLVTRHKKRLVFVEVRTKIGERFGSPEESFNHNKLNRLIHNARAYTARKGYVKDYRVDAVCIVLDKNKEIRRIDHYRNITF